MYLEYNRLCGCAVVSVFLVVAGNCSLNENMFLQKNLIGLLFMIHVFFIRPNTLLLCIFLFYLEEPGQGGQPT
jgi:hypothetical protein